MVVFCEVSKLTFVCSEQSLQSKLSLEALWQCLVSSVEQQPSRVHKTETLLLRVCQWLNRNGTQWTPFPHLQFMAQSVPPPQIVTLPEKAHDHCQGHIRNAAFPTSNFAV